MVAHVESITLNGRLLGGGGITDALHAQMSAFNRFDEARLQAYSRIGKSDASVLFDIEEAM